ncbi:unnamed protein product [Notodromas monacha]|uniref:Uncharacterized protein n=1 Tax=Notodromas monacha TaxID=399045 RepID=A0A7R9BFX4_9CRUS|nr:unnamed protein product [Notodromas monacha]CAG0913754.1 unnamed protein product [Notodromas monacha]
MNPKFLAVLLASALLSSAVSGKPALKKRHRVETPRDSRQLQETSWETVGQIVGTVLVNFVSDDAFQMLTGVLTAGNELLRTADQYLDITEAVINALTGVLRIALESNDRQAKQLNDLMGPLEALGQFSETPLATIMNSVTLLTEYIPRNTNLRQDIWGFGQTLLGISERLNSVIRDLRSSVDTTTDIVNRFTEIRNNQVSGDSRQVGQTINSFSEFFEESSTALSLLTGDFANDVGALWQSVGVLVRDLDENLNATYSSGSIRIGTSAFNLYDMLGDVYDVTYRYAVETLGMEVAEQRLRTLIGDMVQLQTVTTNYVGNMGSQVQSLNNAVSASQVSSSPFDGVLHSASNALASAAVIVVDTSKFLVDVTDVIAKALDDMHRLESDFTRAWIKLLPAEWGFNGNLSGWYNAGRLMAAISRYLASFQSAFQGIADSLTFGSNVMNDAAGVASSAMDPALVNGLRRLVQGK